MVEKLKSISRQIPWSLLLRALIFGASWVLFPVWAFIVLSLLFYFYPFFQPLKFALHFFVLVAIMSITPPALFGSASVFAVALFFSLIFYLLIGLKDLFFIDREPAYETFLFLFVFMLGFKLFFSLSQNQPGGILPILYALSFSILFFLLSRGAREHIALPSVLLGSGRWQVSLLILSFLLFELFLGIAVLPLHFLYQVAIFFLSTAILIEFIFDYMRGIATSRRILLGFSVFIVFIIIIMGSAPWSL